VLLSCPSFLCGRKYHGTEITKIHKRIQKGQRITKYTADHNEHSELLQLQRIQPSNPTHSVLKLFTGLAIAALIAWKLIVIIAITVAVVAATIKTHQLIVIL